MEKLYSHTMALCPVCGTKARAKIVERDGSVYMDKFCVSHGSSSVILSDDAAWYKESRYYVKPKQDPCDVFTKDYAGCPDSCCSCGEHQQHTCLPVIEISDRCDLACPVCLKRFKEPFALNLDEFNAILDSLLRYEGSLKVINISGGEPTLHPELGAFIASAQSKGVSAITVSTNGLALRKNEHVRKLFQETGIIAALQFDGFSPETYRKLRGRDILKEKLELIDILKREDIQFSLVATVAKGINEKEITAITDFFFESGALSIMFQPVAFTGNAASFSAASHRITVSEVVREIEKSRYAGRGDFNPLPCAHFSCFALSYYVASSGRFVSLKEFLGKEKYLDIIANKSLPGLDRTTYSIMKERIYELWSAGDSSSDMDAIIERIKEVLKEMSSVGFTAKEALARGMESMRAIYIHNFMDTETFDFGRVIKCCNPYPQKDGRLIPMCAQNVFFQKR